MGAEKGTPTLRECREVLRDLGFELHLCGGDHRGGPAPCDKCIVDRVLPRLTDEVLERDEKRRAALEEIAKAAKKLECEPYVSSPSGYYMQGGRVDESGHDDLEDSLNDLYPESQSK